MSFFLMAAKKAVGSVPAPPAIVISLGAYTYALVVQGSTVARTVTLTRTNYTDTVSFAVSGLPTGVTGAFSNPTLSGSTLTSVLTLTATGGAPVVDMDAYTITASGAGVTSSVITTAVTVIAANTFDYLAPQLSEIASGMSFNAATGRLTGTTVNTTEPTWTTDDSSITDSGNAATNATALQNKLNALATGATANTRILLPAGALFGGNFTLPVNTSGFWIGIYTASHASLPTLSTGTGVGTKVNRVGPSNASLMPELYPTANGLTMSNADGASKYYVRGINFTNRNAVSNSHFHAWKQDGQSLYPSDIIAAQLLCDGGAYGKTTRSAWIGGTRMAFIDSYATNTGSGADCQHVLMTDGDGPYKVTNNDSTIGGAKENYMVGGVAPNLVPSNIQIQGNVMRGGATGGHKATIEIKWGKKVVITENTAFDHNGGSPQKHHLIIKCASAGYAPLVVETVNVLVMNNYFTEGPGFAATSGADVNPGDPGVDITDTIRVEYINNFAKSGVNSVSGNGRGFSPGGGGTKVRGLRKAWNTVVCEDAAFGGQVMYCNIAADTVVDFEFIGNVGAKPNPGSHALVVDGGGASGEASITYAASGTIVLGPNLLNSQQFGGYPSQVVSGDTVASIGFNGDYSLSGSSPGSGTAPGGKDFGCSMPMLLTIYGERL